MSKERRSFLPGCLCFLVEIQRKYNPIAKPFLAAGPLRAYKYETLHRFSCKVHFPASLVLKRSFMNFRINTGHKVVVEDTHTHFVIDHEGQTTHHFLFHNVGVFRQDSSYSLCQCLVICHGRHLP